MSPKTATLSLALLWLTLTLTLSFATADDFCKGKGSSLPDILKSYDLPNIIFPKPAEKTASCDRLNESAVSIKFTLEKPCTVIRTAVVVENDLTCATEVSATASHRKLSNIKGITVQLYLSLKPLLPIKIPFPFAPQLMTVTDAIVFVGPDGVKKLQFMAKEGNSPAFDLPDDFPMEPPTCDRLTTLGYFPAVDHTYNYKSGGRPLFPLPIIA